MEANPPLLTGGLIQDQSRILSPESRFGVSVDYLTATVSTGDGTGLLTAHTEHEQDGSASEGFEKSERRLCLGGSVWRRWEPREPSKRWGHAYESWRWNGSQAASGVDLVARCENPKITRIDVAFDFQVDDELTALHLVRSLLADQDDEKTPQGFKVGESGDRPHLTMYVGSMSSDRRIRIYRKDIQSPSFAFGCGAVMRVELMLKKRYAEAFWDVFNHDRQAGYAAAAAHILEMSGLVVAEEIGYVPEFVPPEIPDVAQRLFSFVTQHAATLDEFASAGVDVWSLAAQRFEAMSRMTQHRSKQRRSQLREAGPKAIERLVSRMIAEVAATA